MRTRALAIALLAIFVLSSINMIQFKSLRVFGVGTTLYINPPEVDKTPSDVGSTFSVYVTLENFANLAGFDIKLTWNSAVISKASVDYATYLDTLWGPGNWNVFLEESTPGFYDIGAVALAVSGSNSGPSILFKVTFHVDRSSNFPLSTSIHFVSPSLSDNATPIPNPIVPITVTDGTYNMSAITPDLEFKVLKKDKKTGHYGYIDPPYNFEYCDWVEVEIYITHIIECSCLTDYHLQISYNPSLMRFDKVDHWGIFGQGTVSGTGVIDVSGEGNPWSGDEGLLFALTFHVEFASTPDHIWKNGNPNFMEFPIEIANADLTFGSNTVTLSDPELMLSEFAKEWGPGTLSGKTDVYGPGVQFDLIGLDLSSGTGVGDNYPVNALAGGAYKDYGSGFAGYYDFSGYKRYCLCICNVGSKSMSVALHMNTGWTGPPWGTPANNTFWQGNWVNIEPGECKPVLLDFSSATCYQASDDPVVAWQYPDGTTGVTVRRLNQVSNIGFEVLGSNATFVVKGCLPATITTGGITVPAPLTIKVNFIRGDVDCNGIVNIQDIADVAYYYNKPASARPEYDLDNDGTIYLYDLVTIGTNFGYGMDP